LARCCLQASEIAIGMQGEVGPFVVEGLNQREADASGCAGDENARVLQSAFHRASLPQPTQLRKPVAKASTQDRNEPVRRRYIEQVDPTKPLIDRVGALQVLPMPQSSSA